MYCICMISKCLFLYFVDDVVRRLQRSNIAIESEDLQRSMTFFGSSFKNYTNISDIISLISLGLHKSIALCESNLIVL